MLCKKKVDIENRMVWIEMFWGEIAFVFDIALFADFLNLKVSTCFHSCFLLYLTISNNWCIIQSTRYTIFRQTSFILKKAKLFILLPSDKEKKNIVVYGPCSFEQGPFSFPFSLSKKFFPLSFLPLFLFKKRRRREEGVEEENQHILAFLSFSSVSFPSPKGKEEEKKEEKKLIYSVPFLPLFFLEKRRKEAEKKEKEERKKEGEERINVFALFELKQFTLLHSGLPKI